MSTRKSRPAVLYTVVPISPEDHLFEVRCTVRTPQADGQCLALPVWNPGSYMVREYARHVVSAEAWATGDPAHAGPRRIALEKIDKHTWRAEPVEGPLTVVLRVYAWDLSVRGAHLDDTHGFFNGACLFLQVIGQTDQACQVEILPPAGERFADWQMASALEPVGRLRKGFGLFRAADHAELIDHPVEMGTFERVRFKAAGIPHELVVTGRHDADLARIAGDLARICEAQIGFFGQPAPMRRYVFLLTVVGEGYGGLEHRASTALLCSRDDLARAGEAGISPAYRGFLGLASHEYFHTWNVKRIRPAAFSPMDLGRENYTSLLWAFEGFTSYYDDLFLVRTGLIRAEEWLELIARAITALLRTPARHRQSVSESSFDAWIKYYRQEENAPDAVVSYYGKGSLIALALDLALREETDGRRSLDDLMRWLWRHHGLTGQGVAENGIEVALMAQLEGVGRRGSAARLRRLLRGAIDGVDELPLARLLGQVGVRLTVRASLGPGDRGGCRSRPADSGPVRVDIGVRVASDGEARLVNVLAGRAAARAGLAAGDVVIALDGLRVNARTFDARLQRSRPGDRLRVHAFRRDELRDVLLELEAAPPDTCDLMLVDSPDAQVDPSRCPWRVPGRARRKGAARRLPA
jgi:predicted metalloprotease with PDZ domain